MERLGIDVLSSFKAVDDKKVDEGIKAALKSLNRKIVVIDDDPTGAQTVHGVCVYTKWDKTAFLAGFHDEISMFYVMTNSRSFSREKTIRVHAEIGATLAQVATETGQDYILINRGDSTLRGHYPQETAALRAGIEANSNKRFDGEIILPFFAEGGRYTMDNIQYVKEGTYLTPSGQTEFAKDKSFGYKNSHLGAYVEEKTDGRFTKESCTYVSLGDIRNENMDGITQQLVAVKGFHKVIVNAIDYADVKIFAMAFINAVHRKKEFIFRSATSLTKVLGGIDDIPLLTREQLIKKENKNGGIVLIGSHVNRTTRQFEALRDCKGPLEFIEFDQHLVLKENGLKDEVLRVVHEAEKNIKAGKNVVVYTRRDRFDPDTDDKDKQLQVSVQISEAITSIIGKLSIRPNFIVSKGGSTSSDIATKALGINKALVLGQVKPGIPVWLTGDESRFSDMPFIIFPGNVGEVKTLKEIVDMLS